MVTWTKEDLKYQIIAHKSNYITKYVTILGIFLGAWGEMIHAHTSPFDDLREQKSQST